MPRYFFNLEDGNSFLNEEGVVLSGMDEVRSEALRTAAELMRDFTRDDWKGMEWRMNVVDTAGREVFILRFSATEPAQEVENISRMEGSELLGGPAIALAPQG